MPHQQEVSRPYHRFAPPLFLALALLLSACGGGGGGGGGVSSPVTPPVTPPASSSDTPLLLTAGNASAAPVLAFGNGAVALGAAQMVVDWAGQFSTSTTQTKPCRGGGTQSATFSDANANGKVDAGDKLSVTYVACYSKELEGVVDGTMNVTFAAPVNDQHLAGAISFAPGFGDHTSTPREDLAGSLRFDHSIGPLSRMLRIHSDTQPFIMVYSDANQTKKETITALELQHELRIDTARATTSMRYHLASDLLGGSLEVSTATPWRAWFDTYPDAGELLLTGANNSKASLRVNPRPAPDQLNILLGDTVLATAPAQGTGFLWSSGAWRPQNASLDRYDTKSDLPSGFQLLIAPDTAKLAPAGTLTWVYTRTLDTPRLHNALFRQQGNDSVDIPATISTNGAILTVQPATQLRAGATYQLTFDNLQSDPIRDMAGNALSAPAGIVNVTQSISAVIGTNGTPALMLGAGATLTLDAGGSSAHGAPASGTRWRQLSGPALVMDQPNAQRVTLSSPTPAKGVAVIELEASNAIGESDKQRISIDVLTDTTQALVFSYRIGTGAPVIDSNAATAEASYVRYFLDKNVLDIMSTRSHLRFLTGLPANQAWQAGTTFSYGPGNTDGVEGGLLGRYNLPQCTSAAGSFTVLEFARDATGQPSRVALDIDDMCAGTRTQMSIRYGSDLPLR
ncbi:hypothetical protein CSQ92_12395 [Janthinobacterium sp. BJB446]|uniref:Ig-like domain-containing protein n=1 Tax=Janthinobacterium sp. BJB446 TaxID=2048009 RepID=UPI000C0CC413|nr:Ig-like domain-containing protein [Janthinobacterium sp. BJB446]PHV23709.1 hypothetical protein CSQ92_12395 [Janthinobacterium sp. BJB446]